DLGCEVDACADGSSALRSAQSNRFELLLLDRAIPAPDGESVLRQLRADPAAASQHSPAVATSAEWGPARERQALAAGFVAILAKPCTSEHLRQMLRAHLPLSHQPLRDDVIALQHAGGEANLRALRRLFVRELKQLDATLPSLLQNPQALDTQLHRLCASAGFCGASALATATRQWREQLFAGRDPQAGANNFQCIVQSTLKRFESMLQD
ncbi:MAG: response regulator, partial [Xanthomonadales bacterium]|nr:response regulator [Xanthomonadales bacterium]